MSNLTELSDLQKQVSPKQFTKSLKSTLDNLDDCEKAKIDGFARAIVDKVKENPVRQFSHDSALEVLAKIGALLSDHEKKVK